MRTFAPLLMLALVLPLAGCDAPKLKPTKPTERAGGVISQIHDRVDEHVVTEMLKDLHLHILQAETGGQMPTPDDIRTYGKTENKKLGELLDKGAIVLPAKLKRDGLWAYHKETTARGRWIIVQAGPTQVTEDEFKQWQAK